MCVKLSGLLSQLYSRPTGAFYILAPLCFETGEFSIAFTSLTRPPSRVCLGKIALMNLVRNPWCPPQMWFRFEKAATGYLLDLRTRSIEQVRQALDTLHLHCYSRWAIVATTRFPAQRWIFWSTHSGLAPRA